MIFEIHNSLIKNNIALHVLNPDHIEELVLISRDTRIWKFGTNNFSDEKIFREKWIEKALHEMENNSHICFAVMQNNKIVGASSLYHIEPKDKKLSMGYTFFHPDYWGSNINPITKLILFEFVFEYLNYHRVEFTVDSLNTPSRKSLEQFGIQQEGILRNHMILWDGRVRDTVIFSVIAKEWGEIKGNINKRIEFS